MTATLPPIPNDVALYNPAPMATEVLSPPAPDYTTHLAPVFDCPPSGWLPTAHQL